MLTPADAVKGIDSKWYIVKLTKGSPLTTPNYNNKRTKQERFLFIDIQIYSLEYSNPDIPVLSPFK